MHPQDFLLFFHGFLFLLVHGSSISHTRRGLGAGVTQVVDFDCPEEFGYYPHPTDCTQYYVCVFGGALLESCTGGLMYSHELQTCDWPRNVGCTANNNAEDGGTLSTVRVTDPRTRNPPQSQTPSTISQSSPQVQAQSSRNSPRQDYSRLRQQDVIQQQIYTEDIGPAEEIESDRQQRVYRGQPANVAQVQRDRDGLRPLKSNVHTPNVIPTGPANQDKISLVSFGSQRASAPRPQEQYRNRTDFTDLDADFFLDDGTKKPSKRHKRQVFQRFEHHQKYPTDISLFILAQNEGRFGKSYSSNLFSPSAFLPTYLGKRREDEELSRLAKETIQTEFKPVRHFPVRPAEPENSQKHKPRLFGAVSVGNVFVVPKFSSVDANQKPKPSGLREKLINSAGYLTFTTGRSETVRPTTFRGDYRNFYKPPTSRNATGTPSVAVPEEEGATTSVPNLFPNLRLFKNLWLRESLLQKEPVTARSPTQSFIPYTQTYEVQQQQPSPLAVTTDRHPKRAKSLPGDGDDWQTWKATGRRNEALYAHLRHADKDLHNLINEMSLSQTTTTQRTDATSVTTQPTTVINLSRTEASTHQQTVYVTKRPRYDDEDDDFLHKTPEATRIKASAQRPRVEQVQSHQLTSAVPPLTQTPRTIEHYNTSQRFIPDQFDPYYAVYDDVDIYRQNDFSRQQYQGPSSTPSSNIAHQYRGQTTHKQAVELEPVQEPIQQQQHRNTYNQDLYSPPPVIQDFNDQYNVQIDDQQYQQLTQSTPKLSSRSERTNSSKDTLTEPSTSVTRVPENATTKPEPSPIIRRSDSNSYFSISSFGPSTVLLPPLRFQETTQKYFDTSYAHPKTDKPPYSSIIPSLREGNRNNFEPPKNGGPLAKTFNSFDSLLSSFISAVTSGKTATPSPSTTPATPEPPKTSPETIVRSEIGRIHHDPIVITENFSIRQPVLRKQEDSKDEKPNVQTTVVVAPLPLPSSTPVTPPKLSQNDYLAYFVEIEPKKPKQEESAGRGGYFLNPKAEETIESKVTTKSSLDYRRPGTAPYEGTKPKSLSNYVRLLPSTQTQKVQLGTSLSLEPIARPQERLSLPQDLENSVLEKQKLVGPINHSYQPVGKWVIAKDEKLGGFQSTVRPDAFDVYSQERDREPTRFRDTAEKSTKSVESDESTEVNAIPRAKANGNAGHAVNPISPEPELPPTAYGPYKFLYVDVDSTTEQLLTQSPFGRTTDRDRFLYKTHPENRVRGRYFENESTEKKEEVEVTTLPQVTYSPEVDTEDRIKIIYKTNPESRFRSRFVDSSGLAPLDGEKTVEDAVITPKIIVPDIKPEVSPIATLDEKPIQVLPREEIKEPETTTSFKRRKPDYRVGNAEVETSSRKPYRYKPTTESGPEVEAADPEEARKSGLPRRVVKIHRNETKALRVAPNPKLKRFRKPPTKSSTPPIVILDDLVEKTLTKENEIHPTYRPIVVTEAFYPPTNKTRFRFTVEDEKDFVEVPNNKILPVASTEKVFTEAAPRNLPGYEKPAKPAFVAPTETETENDVTGKDSEKPLPSLLKRPQTLKNVTQIDNRATTKAYRGKFKPSENLKLRLRPTTASPDSQTTPGPHLSTRQPGGYTIGSTANEVIATRGTPTPNRGTRPTLKPSTAIVSKASEFIDIYRYPPRRPQNLYATPTPDKSAAKCRKDVCLLPDCSCGGKDIPGGYNAEEIPQLVLLTFDDSVNDLNKGLYAELFERGRVNPNGCPISATFYVSHEWTDYSQVQNLYANGHEIASHSITHSFGEQFSQKKWTKEIAGQREILAAYGGVRLEDIRGMRAPFLAVGGNKMFKMLYDSNFTYDSSMPIYENRPPSWPYTLDYKLFHDCMIPPCPTKSYPGVWEVPMVMWQDLNGGRCSMGDACSNPPTADGVYKMLIKNFERHFTTNRAPFGLYYHAAWFTHEHHKEGFIAFLDTIVNMPEVWLVTNWQAIEWVRDPQPLSTVQNFPPFQCNVEKAKKCNNPKVCNLWHKSGVRYMRTCQPCPDVYPWTGKTGVKNSRVDNEIVEE